MTSGGWMTRRAGRPTALPAGARLLLGLLLLVVGALVVTRPLASLTLLVLLVVGGLLIEAVTRLRPRADRHRGDLVAGLALLLVAVVLVCWPRISIEALAVVVGIGLVLTGLLDLLAGLVSGPGVAEGRTSRLLDGASSLILGALALSWPDLTTLVLAVAFGIRLVLLGLGMLLRSGRDLLGVRRERPAARTAGGAVLARALVLAVSLALLAGSAWLHRGVTEPDDFYAAPTPIPEPGTLIRSRPYSQAVPDGAQGWLILYATTDVDDVPRVASAFVMASITPSRRPRQVILWAHGTQGADQSCAPTLLPEPLPLDGPVAALRAELGRGRVIVGPDYPGLGTAGAQSYLIGPSQGRSALDGVRAARQLTDLRLADETVVWGHSQGGHAALWTGILAPSYAPDVSLLGVAAAAPASDLPGLVETALDSVVGSVMGAFIMRAYAESYPEVRIDDYVDPRMGAIYRAMSQRCLPARATLVSLLTTLAARGPMFDRDPGTGPMAARLAENVPTDEVSMPLHIAQGSADDLILPAVQDRYVRARCAAGQPLFYRRYAERDHLSLVADDSPYLADLEAWTQERFDGTPAGTTC